MDRHYIRDNQVIERYLQGKLTADEEARFEEAYLGDAELLKELEAADLLRRGIKAESAEQRGTRRPSAGDTRAAAAPRYALAASLVAGIALASSVYLYGENRALRAETAAAVTPGARLVPLVSVRGGDPNVVEAAATNDWTVLLVDPGFTPYDRYRAALVRRDAAAAEELLSVDDLAPSYEGLLAVVVPSRLLTAGDYEIVLSGRMRDWPAQRAADDLGRTALTVTAAR